MSILFTYARTWKFLVNVMNNTDKYQLSGRVIEGYIGLCDFRSVFLQLNLVGIPLPVQVGVM